MALSTNPAELYDFLYAYSNIRNYDQEAANIHATLQAVCPAARRILDVGCATGEHALRLSSNYTVDGIDLVPEFAAAAQAKNPGGRFICANMLDFSLDTTYDAILCLSSAIAYMETLDNVARALANFHRHLAPTGRLVIEPWVVPGDYHPGGLSMVTAESPEAKVCRMVYNSLEGGLTILNFDYLIGEKRVGTTHQTERHALGLFTTAQMQSAFAQAGLEAEYDPDGYLGRGLYIGRAQPGSVEV